MPLYEFICLNCGKKATVLCSISQRDEIRKCDFCNSNKLKRLIGKPRRLRSDEEIAEALTDPTSLSGLDENDPDSIKRWAKKTASELGENIDEELEDLDLSESDNNSEIV